MPRSKTYLIAVLFFSAALNFTFDPYLLAQAPAEDATEGSDPRDSAAPTGVSLTVAPAGAGRHVSGRWATVAVNGLNRTDVDAEETAAVMIGDETNVQFARRLWVPARSRRQSWLPIQIPPDLPIGDVQVRMRSFHLKGSESDEQFQSNVVGMPTSDRSLLLSWEESRTAVFSEPLFPTRRSEEQGQFLIETIYAGRDGIGVGGQDIGLVHLPGTFLPPSAKALDPLDQIVIANDRILSDTASVQQLRTWLHSGGRMWIMVDQLDPESVRALLGDAACYSIINRVELNEFEMKRTPAAGTTDKIETEQWSSESPVEFARVIVDTEDVYSRIDGWPAAFWQPVGSGEVLFTTLGARGWVREGEPSLALLALSSRFFVNRIEPPRHTKKIASFLDDEIGYRIPSRASVAGVLGLHMLIVLLAGAWLAHRKSLHLLAILVPVAALIATGSLLALGKQQTTAVPSTIAIGQIARVIPESSQVQVNSVAAVYSQQAQSLPITSSPDTTTLIADADSSSLRRVLWDDSGESNWLYVTQPPGVIRHVVSQSIVSLPQPWTFKGRFTKDGFTSRISGLSAADCQDGVIVTAAAPSLAVDFTKESSGFVLSQFDDVLSPGQFIDEALMSDTQQDRQELLRDLMSADTPVFDRSPTLLVWTNPIDSGVTFEENYVRRGSTLAAIPVQLERLASGMDFQVPASFVRMESHMGGRGMSTMFNAETGRWLDEMNKPSESELRCVPPKVLLPCKLNRATVLVKINAPSRTLEVKGFVDGEFVTLHSRENPTGLLRFEIDDPRALELDAEGGLLISLAISETEEERLAASAPVDSDEPRLPSRSTWGIDYVHVNLEGTSL